MLLATDGQNGNGCNLKTMGHIWTTYAMSYCCVSVFVPRIRLIDSSLVCDGSILRKTKGSNRGTKRLFSENMCSVEGNSAAIFVSKVSPGVFVIKVK